MNEIPEEMSAEQLASLNETIVRSLRKLNAVSRRGQYAPPVGDDPGTQAAPRRENGRGRIMGILSRHGPMSQTKLAEYLDIRPQSLSELICKMEGDGMVSRRHPEEDKRQTIVSLTEMGRMRVSHFREAQRKNAEAFLSPLTVEERRIFSVLLEKLAGSPASSDESENHPNEPASGTESDRTGMNRNT